MSAQPASGMRFGLMWPNTRSQSIMSAAIAESNPDPLDLRAHLALAAVCEEVGIDFAFFADSYAHNGDASAAVGHGEPRIYAPIWAAALLAATDRLKVVTTLHARYLPAAVIARIGANLDALGNGRWGWNVVPGAKPGEAGLFGLDGSMEHDRRYATTSETVRAVKEIWSACGAPVSFEGEYVQVEGRLAGPSPAVTPPLFNPGVSPAGLALTAAECDFAFSAFVDDLDENRAAVDRLATAVEAAGRDPRAVRLTCSASIVLGADTADAKRRLADMEATVDLAAASGFANFFLSTSQTYQRLFDGWDREAVVRRIGAGAGATIFVGDPADVADQIIAASAATGVRDFLITPLRWRAEDVRPFGDMFAHLERAGVWTHPATRGPAW